MVKNSKEEEINDLIKKYKKDVETRGESLERRSLEIMGTKQILDVYHLPISPLRYNIRNGRFAAELQEKESEMGRKLNPNKIEDSDIIKDILLNQEKDQKEILKEDIREKGQIDPGLITYDGQIINGNRRMAILEELYTETKNEKYQFLDVQMLPKSVDEKGLWRIEAGLQLSRDKRLDYSPINQLLKLEEGVNAGLLPDEIASAYYGNTTVDKIKEDLKRLNLIREYLIYIEKDGEYKYVRGLSQHFIALQKKLLVLEKKTSDKMLINEATIIGFEVILGGAKFLDVRSIADVILINKAYDYLNKSIEKIENGDIDYDVEESKESEENDDDEEKYEEPTSSESITYNEKRDKARRIVDAYIYAKEIVKFEKDKDRPLFNINKAIDLLDSIDIKNSHFKTSKVENSLVILYQKVEDFLSSFNEK